MKKEFIVERDGKSFVLYAGLLDLAHERGLRGITTTLVQVPGELNGMTAIVHATVETEAGQFTGLGDAAPGNVTRMMAPHLIRMAETRAKARALRDAVNVGVTALEELADEGSVTAHASGGADPPRSWGSAERGERAHRPEPWPGHPEAGPRSAVSPPRTVGESTAAEPDDIPPHTVDVEAIQSAAERQGPIPFVSRDVDRPAAPATPKQLQTISRMARAAGKTIPTDGLTRSQASEIITGLAGERRELGR